MGNTPQCCCEMKGSSHSQEVVQIQTKRGIQDYPNRIATEGKADTATDENSAEMHQVAARMEEADQQDSKARFRVHFPKDDRLGAEIAVYDKRGFALVRSVSPEGLIAKWNANNPSRQVTEGCYVLEANGKRVNSLTPKELEDMIAVATEVDLLISTVMPVSS
mmetsp:Transcript_8192/g.18326  ORF Transcript_8192/g.18326 Transcript_8192/m.18326 type:complete len:163 (+) Transcript_8192:88-576(+)